MVIVGSARDNSGNKDDYAAVYNTDNGCLADLARVIWLSPLPYLESRFIIVSLLMLRFWLTLFDMLIIFELIKQPLCLWYFELL